MDTRFHLQILIDQINESSYWNCMLINLFSKRELTHCFLHHFKNAQMRATHSNPYCTSAARGSEGMQRTIFFATTSIILWYHNFE